MGLSPLIENLIIGIWKNKTLFLHAKFNLRRWLLIDWKKVVDVGGGELTRNNVTELKPNNEYKVFLYSERNILTHSHNILVCTYIWNYSGTKFNFGYSLQMDLILFTKIKFHHFFFFLTKEDDIRSSQSKLEIGQTELFLHCLQDTSFRFQYFNFE